MDPGLRRLLAGAPAEEIPAFVRLSPGASPPARMRLIAQFGEIATCRLPRSRIASSWADESVVSLKAARPFGIDPDPLPVSEDAEAASLPGDRRRPEGLQETGRGVIVAVIDWGFDFAHPNFRNPDGSTRALAFWDQSAPGPGPQPYGYGRVYRREEINEALAHADPYSALGYHPAIGDPGGRGSHGTHVLDIAAGNGRAQGAPSGIAPEADLLFVHLDVAGTGGRANLGHSVSLAEALHWVAREAGTQCAVVNLSVGRHGGPHHGLTLVEQAIDALLAEHKGFAIVQSAGNYYDARVHASGTLRPGQSSTLCWVTDAADITPNELELWYPGGDVFGLKLEAPDGRKFDVPLGDDATIVVDGADVGQIFHRAKDPAAGDNHIDVFLEPSAPAGSWSLRVTGEDIVDGRWHAWVERDAGCPSCQSRFIPEHASHSCTTGTIANGFRAVAVGAYDAHRSSRTIATFSSSGPTRDGRTKPDLLAPGVRILAARSAPRNATPDTAQLFRQSGTSMAAPHVTGTIAVMFEAARRPISIQETRRLLLSTAERTGGDDLPERSGSGRLNIEDAVAAARRVDAGPTFAARIETLVARAPTASAREELLESDQDVAVEVAVEAARPHECSCGGAKAKTAVAEVISRARSPAAFVESSPPKLVDHKHAPRECSSGAWTATGSVASLTPDSMNPGFIKPDDLIEFDAKLDAALVNLIVDDADFRKLIARESVKKRYPSGGDRLRVALVDLSGAKLCTPGYAGWGSTTRMSGASSAKVAILYAAHQLSFDLQQLALDRRPADDAAFRRGADAHFSKLKCAPDHRWLVDLDLSGSAPAVKMSSQLDTHLTHMVDASHHDGNQSATLLVLRLGFEFIGSALWQSGLRHPTRGGLWFPNTFQAMPPSPPRKAACHAGTAPVRWVGNPLREPGITITALSAATLLTLMAQQRLIDSAHSAQIESLLSRGCTVTSAPAGLRVRAAKCGLASGNRHEVLLIETDRLRYVLVYLTKDASQWSEATHTRFIQSIHDLVAANNP